MGVQRGTCRQVFNGRQTIRFRSWQPANAAPLSVETKLRHRAAVVLLGNSITLTPGTITAEVDVNNLIVHSMDNVLSEDITSKQMESKIADIFKDEEPDL